MKGAILEKGEPLFTFLDKIFASINHEQNNYNWLITDCVCYPFSPALRERFSHEYCFVSGMELTKIIKTENFQWVWAVLSGFKKNISLEQILAFDLPYADGYKNFWYIPISMQNPLAAIEIVPWDSSLLLLISQNDTIVNRFLNYFPLSEDLALYNKKFL